MQINLSLVNVHPGFVADAFEERIAPKLIDHLYTECTLDQDGIKRVLPLLRKAFMSAGKGLTMEAYLTAAEDGENPSQGDQEDAQAFVNDLALKTGKVIDENRLTMMISLATALAEQDEKLVKRTRH
jgi:hypothetical protein